MPTLTCMRGLPGSGKSTLAKFFCENSDGVRLNRDDLRASLFNGEGILLGPQENLITTIQQSAAREALRAGKDVFVDDMNLRPRYLTDWNKLAIEMGADFKTYEVRTDVGICIQRDSARERTVGEDVIRDLAQKFFRDGKYLPYEPIEAVPVEKIEYDHELPDAIIVDIDGTVTLGPHERKPFDWAKVAKDQPRWDVIDVVRSLIREGHKQVIFMSGRDSVCREATERWLWLHGLRDHVPFALHMRTEGDMRKDSIVKRELFDQHIRGKYNVSLVFDDRDSVVRMWRDLGLTCAQVDYGNF